MITTNFLATVIGWYLVIMSILLLCKRELIVSAINELMTQRATMLLVGIMTFIVGLLLVVSHNVWVMAWPVVVTIIAWLTLIGGLIRLFCPDTVHKIWKRVIDKPVKIVVCGIISLIVGLFLLYNVYATLIHSVL